MYDMKHEQYHLKHGVQIGIYDMKCVLRNERMYDMRYDVKHDT